MEFISIPLVFGIVTLGIYKLFELFAGRRERMAIIEKLSAEQLAGGFKPLRQSVPTYFTSFGPLKIGCLLAGLGLGMLVGLALRNWGYVNHGNWGEFETVLGASVLLFGGLGLVASFFFERYFIRAERKQQ